MQQKLRSTMEHKSGIVAIYDNSLQVDQLLRDLTLARFPGENITVAAESFEHEHQSLGTSLSRARLATWGSLGAFWSRLWATLPGSGSYPSPGRASTLVAGFLVHQIQNSLHPEGLDTLAGGLYRFGFPLSNVLEYQNALRNGSILVILSGNDHQVQLAQRIVEASGAAHVPSHRLASQQGALAGTAHR
jgi:hypothetical protein